MESSFSQKDINATWEAVWDTQPHIEAEDLFKHRLFEEGYARFRQHIGEGPVSLLEVGGGSGRYGLALAREFPNAQITITDTLPNATANILRYASELRLSNVTVEEADVCALPYKDGAFDIVFGDAVIQHILDEGGAMSELTRVLKPNGKLLLSVVNTWNPPHYLYKKWLQLRGEKYEYGQERTYTPSELANLFSQYRLKNIQQDGFYLAYGLYRLKKYWRAASLLSRILNRIIKVIDAGTGRFLSKTLGFEIFCVGWKLD